MTIVCLWARSFASDVGSRPGVKFDPHSPNNYVTRAQASTVFRAELYCFVGAVCLTFIRVFREMLVDTSLYACVEVSSGEMVWLGNQWVSGHGAVRNSDLLYWSVLRFDDKGEVQQFEWSANCTLPSRRR